MGRKRSNASVGLPPNLYLDEKGFIYRNPLTGKKKRLSRKSRDQAVSIAREANRRIEQQRQQNELTANIKAVTGSVTVAEAVKEYIREEITPSHQKPGTKQGKKRVLHRLADTLQDTLICDIRTPQITTYLDQFRDLRSGYSNYRTILIHFFQWSIGKGYRDETNPATNTLPRARKKKLRPRLKEEEFWIIYDHSPEWLQHAMLIGLYSLQRLEDIASLRRDQIDGNNLLVKVNKSEGEQFKDSIHLKIYMGAEFKKVIQQCLQTPIASPYVLATHPIKTKAEYIRQKPHWSYIQPRTLSKWFSRVRDETGLFDNIKDKKFRPGFYEIRSLGAHLYEKKGFPLEYVQRLMGHSTGRMTQYYQKGHEIDWQEVKAELTISRNS